MDKQQQVLEMAKDICRVKLNCNDVCNPISACDALKYAERAVEAGYSKQSEVIDEFVGELKEYLDDTYSTGEDVLIEIHNTIDYIAQKMKDGNKGVKGTPKKTYYTPDEVRNMSMNEIRDNITAIRKSMKRWRDE